MNGTQERVFIAWGKNRVLAQHVSEKIKKSGFVGIVGGGAPTDMYIGNQIISQIKSCTRTIILLQHDKSSSEVNFSDNLMFEWGYMTHKLPPEKIHIYLVGLSVNDLPSDIAGAWATEICLSDDIEQTAELIASDFAQVAQRKTIYNKMDIIHQWAYVKRLVEDFPVCPACSELELANYLLHSIESCYYFMEEDYFNEIVVKISPVSKVLSFIQLIVEENITLFKESENLTKTISHDSYYDLFNVFTQPFDFSDVDPELDAWTHYICKRREMLLHALIANNEELEEEEVLMHIEAILKTAQESLDYLDKVCYMCPQDEAYADRYRCYIYRDLEQVYLQMGDIESAQRSLDVALGASRNFYISYKSAFPHDRQMVGSFAQEYYLTLVDAISSGEMSMAEILSAKRAVKSFLAAQEKESSRQHTVFYQLKSKFERLI